MTANLQRTTVMECLLAQPGDHRAVTLPDSPHVGLPQPVPSPGRLPQPQTLPHSSVPNKGPLSEVPQLSGQPTSARSSWPQTFPDLSCSFHPTVGSGLV